MLGELGKRLIFGPLMAASAAGLLLLDTHTQRHWGLLGLVSVGVVLASRELARLARPVAPRVQTFPILITSLLLMLDAFIRGGGAAAYVALPDEWQRIPSVALIIAVGSIWAMFLQMTRRGPDNFFANTGSTIFAIAYIGLAGNMLINLGLYPPVDANGVATHAGLGSLLLILMLATVKLGDVTAYFGGRMLGRHKMSPVISPGKTWEGFACSFIGSVGGTYGVNALLGLWGQTPLDAWWKPLLWGLVIGPIGVVGDLLESCMKRETGVKDSGRSIPGFGGVLDVFDAIIPAAPVAYVLALLLTG